MSVEKLTYISNSRISGEGIKWQLCEAGIPVTLLRFDADTVAAIEGNEIGHVVMVDSYDAVDAVELCRHIRQRLDAVRIVVLSEILDAGTVGDGFRLGINGFLDRSISFQALSCKLALVCAGEKVLPSETLMALMTGGRGGGGPRALEQMRAELSERELAILRCLAEGTPNKIISRQLSIAEPTVKIHVKAILRKLQVSNRTQAAVWAINNNKLTGATRSG